jgi:hypothetical protein
LQVRLASPNFNCAGPKRAPDPKPEPTMRASSLIFLVALGLFDARAAQGQQSQPRDLAFGFSAVSYLFEASDGVFTDNDEHMPGNVGFRLTKAFFGDRSWGWMLDGELYLGVANRQLLDVDMPNTIFGLHAFVGPVIALGSLQLYGTLGVNRTTVGESEIVEVPAGTVEQYLREASVSDHWTDILLLASLNSAGGDVIASIPRYSNVSAAGMFGASYDIGGSALGLRLALEYIPIFIGPARNNLRITLALAG